MSKADFSGGGATTRGRLRLYALAVAMWQRGFDSQSIATEIAVPESTVAKWIANFRDVMAHASS